jgi:hypothetical protein
MKDETRLNELPYLHLYRDTSLRAIQKADAISLLQDFWRLPPYTFDALFHNPHMGEYLLWDVRRKLA